MSGMGRIGEPEIVGDPIERNCRVEQYQASGQSGRG
jgi:hypothetical protein